MKEFVLAHTLRVQSIAGTEALQQEHETAGHMEPSLREERAVNAGALPCCSFGLV